MKKLLTKKNVSIVAILGISCAFAIDHFYRNFSVSYEVYKSIAEPLFDLSLSLFIVSIFLLFVHEQVFLAWRKFAFVWLPISILIIAITPNTSGNFQVIDKEIVAIALSVLFVIVSLTLIAYKSFASRKQ